MKKGLYYLIKASQHELISGSMYMFAGSMVLNICAFVFNLLFARNLSTGEYGTYTALIALFTVATIPAQPIATTIVAFASKFFADKDIAREAYLYRRSLLMLSVIAGAFMLLTDILMPFVVKFLHISQPLLVLFVGIMVGVFYIGIIQNAFLQARLQFFISGVLMACSGIVKVIFGIFFLLLGLQVFGAIGATALSVSVSLVVGFYPLRKLLLSSQKPTQIDFKRILFYAVPASTTIISLTLLTSTDLILVKHYFSATQAGLYAGITLIGKSIFYFTGTIPVVMFPLLIKRYKKGENVNTLLLLSVILVLVPSLFATILFALYPSIIIALFLGKSIYQHIANYIWIYGIFITMYSVINIFALFFLSLEKRKVAYILVSGAILQFLLISFFHETFYLIIFISLILTLFIMVILLLYYQHLCAEKRRQQHHISP